MGIDKESIRNLEDLQSYGFDHASDLSNGNQVYSFDSFMAIYNPKKDKVIHIYESRTIKNKRFNTPHDSLAMNNWKYFNSQD